MTRKIENIVRFALSAISFCMVCSSGALIYGAFLPPRDSDKISFPSLYAPATRNAIAASPNPKMTALKTLKMTRVVVSKAEVEYKPPTPRLSSLIRIKGIMDTGDPKSTEAIIEVLRGGQTKFCKTGETISEAGATITKIDDGVTFTYDGKSERLRVNEEDAAGVSGSLIEGATVLQHNP